MSKEKSEAGDFDKELDAVKTVLKALGKLSDTGKQWVLKTVADRLGLQAPAGSSGTPAPTPGGAPATPSTASTTGMTPKQFLAIKKPVTDVEQIACLAFYMSHNKNEPHFKTKDLTALNTEAAGRRLSNAARSVNNATHQSGFLASAGGGKKQITTLGEEVVNALPDREAVKRVVEQAPTRKRGKAKRRKSGTGKGDS